MARGRERRDVPEIGLSFLDVISCGFGAVILLLMITRIAEPVVIEETSRDLEGRIAELQETLFDLRGEVRIRDEEMTALREDVTSRERKLAQLARERSFVQGRVETLRSQRETADARADALADARQTLTAEMQRLAERERRRDESLVGGVPVDSEYVIFVIDTSGSMQQLSWTKVQRQMIEVLEVYPEVKGIQVLNDMGEYMFDAFRGRWIPDTPARRQAIIRAIANWQPFSNSSPVEGIQEAIRTFYDPDRAISVYVFGDDYSGDSISAAVAAVDRLNGRGGSGARRVRIHGIGFPALFEVQRGQRASFERFAALMRELAHRNGGTFVALTR